MIRIRCGVYYAITVARNPQNSIGNYVGSYIVQGFGFRAVDSGSCWTIRKNSTASVSRSVQHQTGPSGPKTMWKFQKTHREANNNKQ